MHDNELTEDGKSHIYSILQDILGYDKVSEDEVTERLFFNKKYISMGIWNNVIGVKEPREITVKDIDNGLSDICNFDDGHIELSISYNSLSSKIIQKLKDRLFFTSWGLLHTGNGIPIVSFAWDSKK